MRPRYPAPNRQPRTPRQAARRTLVISAVLVVFVVAGATAAFAATPPPATPTVPVAPDLNTVLNNIRNWVMGMLAAVALVFLTVGGARYLMAGGDPAEVSKAKESLRNAAWGFGLTALAPVAVQILKQIVG